MKRARRRSDVEGLVTHATSDTSKVVEARHQNTNLSPDQGPTLPTDRVDPAQLLGISVLLGLLLSMPSLLRAIHGQVALITAAWYFAWAVALSALGVWLLWAVWHTYRKPIDEQHRRDWEQERAERLAEIEAENLVTDELARHQQSRLADDEVESLRTMAPPDPFTAALPDRRSAKVADGELTSLPRSLRVSIEVPMAELSGPGMLSDPAAETR
jgi:hypothetical protein